MLVWKLTMNEYDQVVFKNLRQLMECVKAELQGEMGNTIYEEIEIIVKPEIMSEADFNDLAEADI